MRNIKYGLEIPNTSKRYGGLYQLAFTKENLYKAYLEARKGKRNKVGTYLFEKNIGENIDNLFEELQCFSYKPREYRTFTVYEPKERVIKAPHFRDLVVQHSIYRVIYNIFNKSFIDTSFACRKNGGTHKCSVYTQTQMKKYNGNLYFIKLDIRKFFYSIDRGILRKLFEKKIKDKQMIDIMTLFTEDDSSSVGIPIGNLLSQLYSLIYLNELDHFVKRELKIKSYVRYVDDFVLIGLTLDEAKIAKEKCEKFVQDKLNLELSHWHIQKIKRGINFVGYRTWKNVKFVRKHSLYKFKRATKKQKVDSIISLIGHAKGTKSLSYFKNILENYMPYYKNLIPTRSRKCLDM